MERLKPSKNILVWMLALLCAPAWAAAQAPALAARVISLSPFITETIYLLGAQDQLLADTSYCTVPPEAAQKEKIGSVTQMNVEKIISLQPDLVISSPLSKEKQLRILRSQGLRLMQIPNPKTFDQMCAITLKIAEALGKTAEAKTLIKQASDDVDKIRREVAGLIPRRVFIQIGLKPLHTVNKDLFINEYLILANAVNITANQPSGVYSREEVIKQDPDVILVATMGSNKKAAILEKKRWMAFPSLTSAKNNEIHVLDPEVICHPTPVSFASGLKQVSALIHPAINSAQESR
ncbi:helical backbone metal receptor [Desulfobacter postgatei]|jgi:iron complex transport system substrate-binding protein|uniref:ABC transporter substrate-binding protein n=1 Tax=Desulfobacter postgatei TaxID=2293 RepID=UPI002A35C31A|nr:helical backbone metal receptor [Desulfobacter postgatei]MDX9963148.1 helical backbone metal receptor [Desulfobacter postgatei]